MIELLKRVLGRTHSKQIKNGIALLNDFFDTKEWAYRIELDELDMGDVSTCVLGQLFGSFNVALFTLGLSRRGSFDCGFDLVVKDIGTRNKQVAELGKEWKKAIKKLRGE